MEEEQQHGNLAVQSTNNPLLDVIERRKQRDRDRKRNMSAEDKQKARVRADARRAVISEEDLLSRREKDRERKRIKLLDVEYKAEMRKREKERQALLDKETLDRKREKDRVRKRAEYRLRIMNNHSGEGSKTGKAKHSSVDVIPQESLVTLGDEQFDFLFQTAVVNR